mmetsp:Transcript_13749/g.18257  ORF Transcript_13749/g.18257 Transcript_13749/m.18257 type:complete len:237 (-) Transcript_13749:129-839(-)
MLLGGDCPDADADWLCSSFFSTSSTWARHLSTSLLASSLASKSSCPAATSIASASCFQLDSASSKRARIFSISLSRLANLASLSDRISSVSRIDLRSSRIWASSSSTCDTPRAFSSRSSALSLMMVCSFSKVCSLRLSIVSVICRFLHSAVSHFVSNAAICAAWVLFMLRVSAALATSSPSSHSLCLPRASLSFSRRSLCRSIGTWIAWKAIASFWYCRICACICASSALRSFWSF